MGQRLIEVYRDVDANFNGKADLYRWLGTAGTRAGVDRDEDGQIDAWLPPVRALPSARRVRWSMDIDPQEL